MIWDLLVQWNTLAAFCSCDWQTGWPLEGHNSVRSDWRIPDSDTILNCWQHVCWASLPSGSVLLWCVLPYGRGILLCTVHYLNCFYTQSRALSSPLIDEVYHSGRVVRLGQNVLGLYGSSGTFIWLAWQLCAPRVWWSDSFQWSFNCLVLFCVSGVLLSPLA